MKFEDMWRHNSEICVEVTFENYINFLAENPELLSYFYLKDFSYISKCKCSSEINDCIKIYSYFVRDVVMAYISEILDAVKKIKILQK